jgi:hypothetical protein
MAMQFLITYISLPPVSSGQMICGRETMGMNIGLGATATQHVMYFHKAIEIQDHHQLYT